jgi:RNA polymerase sigma factor (sigma-70 family)
MYGRCWSKRARPGKRTPGFTGGQRTRRGNWGPKASRHTLSCGRYWLLSDPAPMPETKRALVERLFAKNGGALRAFFRKRLPQPQDAGDLAQEVYVRMLRLSDAGTIRHPEAYLYTVASNLAREHRVIERRRGSTIDIEEAEIEGELAELSGVIGDIDTERRVKHLREVLRQLPPKCYAVVALQYWHGMSYAEIAAELGISVRMVKRYLNQGLAHCRRRMARLR